MSKEGKQPLCQLDVRTLLQDGQFGISSGQKSSNRLDMETGMAGRTRMSITGITMALEDIKGGGKYIYKLDLQDTGDSVSEERDGQKVDSG